MMGIPLSCDVPHLTPFQNLNTNWLCTNPTVRTALSTFVNDPNHLTALYSVGY